MVYYNYSTSGIGGALVRLDNIASDNTDPAEADKFAAYGYLGAGTVVKVAYPAVTVSSNPLALTYWTSGGGYAGFDGLGRVIAQKWQIQSGGAVKDHFTYGYDANSSRLYRTNEVDHTFDELYHANGAAGSYDGLDRLKDFRRGQLTASGQVLDTVATASRTQQWTLDAVGNWGGFKSTTQPYTWDHEQTRDHNKANEIEDGAEDGDAIEVTTGGAWVQPAYDLAGNPLGGPSGMTTGPKPDSPATPQVCTYDAWNRLMTVSEGSGTPTLIVTYSYDGLNRRIRKVLAVPDPDVTYDYYYNERWQVLEVRKGGNANPYEQYVWGLNYIDAPVVRFRDHTGGEGGTPDGTVDDTLYYMYDAQFNVTALVEPDGTVAERYVYDPYGKVSFLDGSWGALSASAYDNEILYCGYRFDPESGLYQVRYRYLHSTVGRWVTRDPIGYAEGMSLYEYVASMPTRAIDPLGLDPGYGAFQKAQREQQRKEEEAANNFKKTFGKLPVNPGPEPTYPSKDGDVAGNITFDGWAKNREDPIRQGLKTASAQLDNLINLKAPGKSGNDTRIEKPSKCELARLEYCKCEVYVKYFTVTVSECKTKSGTYRTVDDNYRKIRNRITNGPLSFIGRTQGVASNSWAMGTGSDGVIEINDIKDNQYYWSMTGKQAFDIVGGDGEFLPGILVHEMAHFTSVLNLKGEKASGSELLFYKRVLTPLKLIGLSQSDQLANPSNYQYALEAYANCAKTIYSDEFFKGQLPFRLDDLKELEKPPVKTKSP